MTAAEFSALLLLATATSFTPGPNTTLSTAIAANRGLRGAMRFVCAVPTGWAGLFVLCALGVGGLVLAVPALRARRARQQQKGRRQQARQRCPPGGEKGRRQLRVGAAAGGHARGRQGDGEDRHTQHAEPEAGQQARIALQAGAHGALQIIHTEVATRALAIRRLNHSRRSPCVSQWRSSEPISA